MQEYVTFEEPYRRQQIKNTSTIEYANTDHILITSPSGVRSTQATPSRLNTAFFSFAFGAISTTFLVGEELFTTYPITYTFFPVKTYRKESHLYQSTNFVIFRTFFISEKSVLTKKTVFPFSLRPITWGAVSSSAAVKGISLSV